MNSNPKSDETSAALRVLGLSFSYGQRHVFTAWSHDFQPGLTWVRGSNGCGKSTLLRLLGGALAPQAGSMQVQGDRGTLASHAADARERLAYRRQVFWCGPGPIVFDHLSPNEYFAFMRHLYPAMNDTRLAQHLEGFGLIPFVNGPMGTLSSGTQRKVWLAMALAAGTAVTLLDEPINALDASSVAYLLTHLTEFAKDRSRCVVVASHEDLGDAGAIASTLDLFI